MKRNMKNYAQVLTKFEKLLHKADWPKTLFVTPGMYWDVIIASDGEIDPDWHFHPTGEDEGYPFFLMGPTMVRVDNDRANQTALKTFKEVEDERIESKEIAENGVRPESGVEPGGVLPESPTAPELHSSKDVPKDRPKADSSGSGRWLRGGESK